ncbi:uncharacterized protein LOC124538909 isoform X2 [Vanessa cardui]|uniref:uncharacterized protein LOC124538909 isoform X2 n=1 Tax=Vanessa cardui TaxID=171605 RepID=UPI001F1366CC|nr:uncharacterized protein LOC124538909 isoform X2 [Vanessa cardui]XP_046972124.1 uncharacterized protein LOC124538909 isoform X2 [Vanessa cardui]
MNQSTKAAPMSKDETMILVKLVAANEIINSKSTNATNNKLKEQTWQTLASEFNSSVTSLPRTPSQLRLKWENLKKSARKRCANMKSTLNETGGDKNSFPPDEVLDKVSSILGNTCQRLSVEFGGDATDNSIKSEDVERLVPENGNGNIDSDGDCGDSVCQEEVLKKAQFHETPPRRRKNFYLNRASGSSILVKRKHKLDEEKCKARIFREKALAEYLISKKKKIDLEVQEKEIQIAKLKIELETAKLENLILKADLRK